MPRYSIKKRRNIRKYKKSSKGRGKGRRSIRRCTTRKPKVFRKSRRNNVSNRRRMVGGEWSYSFRPSLDEIKKLFEKYPESIHSLLEELQNLILDSITIVGYGVAMVTKSSEGFLRKNHRVEQVVAVRYEKDGKYFIAIIRCKVPDICLFADQCDTTLFVNPVLLGYADVNLTSQEFKYKDDFVKHLVERDLVGRTDDDIMALNFGMFTFKNMHGDKGSYRFVLCKDSEVLSPNFPKKVITTMPANDQLFDMSSFRQPVPAGGAEVLPTNIFKLFEYIYDNKDNPFYADRMRSLLAVDYPPDA